MYAGVVVVVGGPLQGPRGRARVLVVGLDPVRLVARLRRCSSCLAAYSVGLPEQPRTRRAALVAALVATAIAALVDLAASSSSSATRCCRGSSCSAACVVLVPVVRAVRGAQPRRRRRAPASGTACVVVATSRRDGRRSKPTSARAPETPAVARRLADAVRGRAVAARAGATARRHGARAPGDRRRAESARAGRRRRRRCRRRRCTRRGVRIRTLSMFYEQWLGKLPIAELERVSLLFDIGELHAAGYARVKRLLDVVLALVRARRARAGDPVRARRQLDRQPRSAVLPPAADRAERHDLRDPEVPHDARASRRGSAPTGPPSDDVRITPFGGVLRRTHLDELPQVVNILRGDLSVVGPRPEQPQVVAELVGKIPYYGLRHLVRPGLTGWAQVKYQYAGTEAETLEKLQYEFFYLRHQSLGLDLRIVAPDVPQRRREGRPMSGAADGVGRDPDVQRGGAPLRDPRIDRRADLRRTSSRCSSPTVDRPIRTRTIARGLRARSASSTIPSGSRRPGSTARSRSHGATSSSASTATACSPTTTSSGASTRSRRHRRGDGRRRR